MTDTKIIFLTHSEPNPVGNGGNHRSYQIYDDLQRVVFADQIKVLVRPSKAQEIRQNVPKRAAIPASKWIKLKHRIKLFIKRIRATRENPYYLLSDNNFSIAEYITADFVADYERVVRDTRPQIIVIDHVGFAPIIAVNQKYNIKTIACPQNLESLDTPFLLQSRWGLNATLHNWAGEVSILKQCDACLCISRVESALLNGLGYQADYYAYQPVGEINASLSRIRQNRNVSNREQGLFLMFGSAFHHSTREGMLWFLRQIAQNQLPDGIRIIIFGAQSHTLPSINGVTIHGWIEQDQLEDYLTRAVGILIPQFRGFGASTKLIECATIGIPIIATEHVAAAVNSLPQVLIAQQRWDSWVQAMYKIMQQPVSAVPLTETNNSMLRTHIQELLN